MRFIDTHCHLDLSKNRNSFSENIDNNKIYSIAVTNLPSLFQKNKVILPETKYIKHALGYHPELIAQFPDQLEKFKRMMSKTRYIGEIGIDGSLKHKKSLSLQTKIFENILYLCNEDKEKILTIHSRKAEIEVISIIKKYINNKKILHWYSGGIQDAETAIELGCYFSFNHRMLSSQKGKDLLSIVPKEQILLETDFPFGYANEKEFSNKYFEKMVEQISQLKSCTNIEILDVIQINQLRLLSKS